MSTSNEPIQLPSLPFAPHQLLSNLSQHPPQNLRAAFAPFQAFESQLRSIYAQQPDHPVIADPHVNLVPVFQGHQDALTSHARDPSVQTQAENDTYILPLSNKARRKHGSPAVVPSLEDFKRNFSIFSESSLSELDWSNVVAAGSSVLTPLLPVPDRHDSKRGRRKYYHEVIAPASDVDLFLYGLDEEQALAKIQQIESAVKDSQLKDVTTIRTKNTITIASAYPTRHVQIVLRIYKSVSEILAGFDVDCSCVAFDGSQVYASPRALLSVMTQVNSIDITRRSPSYENRLFKYHKRGFEIYWPQLDRSLIDPTIFERSFARVQGLARLLVLEQTPEHQERQQYAIERRRQRGRPDAPSHPLFMSRLQLASTKGWKADIKQHQLGEGLDGTEGFTLSSYHTFTIPYGPKYNAKKIEKLLYTQDLLLNATWNQASEREVDLHRHPAFFGDLTDVVEDCCGCCPAPTTHEEKKVAEEEGKTFISGPLTFLKDNPGRQEIGSFHPLTDDDWTAMAYVGETAHLCAAALSKDLSVVRAWCEDEENDVDRRDSAGRTPLQLAVMTSSPPVVQCLIEKGARITARLIDGRTALHLAAFREGEVGREIVRLILSKSDANRADHEVRVKSEKHTDDARSTEDSDSHNSEEEEEEDEEGVMISDPSEDVTMSTASNISVVNVDKADKRHTVNENADENLNEPDVYDVDVPAWDQHASALHLAIVSGNTAVAEELVSNFGANLTLPVIIPDEFDPDARKIILPLVLTRRLVASQADGMIQTLLDLGASCAQADKSRITALHRFAAAKFVQGLRVLLENDQPAARQALNYIAVSADRYASRSVSSPLIAATVRSDFETVKALLQHGAKANITFEDFVPHLLQADKSTLAQSSAQNKSTMYGSFEQPVILAAQDEEIKLVDLFLEHGADVNTLTNATMKVLVETEFNDPSSIGRDNGTAMQSLLDVVRDSLDSYAAYNLDSNRVSYFGTQEPLPLPSAESRLVGLEAGTFKHWRIQRDIKDSQASYDAQLKSWREHHAENDCAALLKAMDERKSQLQQLEARLIARGAKTFYELHAEHPPPAEGFRRRDAGHPYTPSPRDCKVTSDYNLPDLNDTVRAGYDQLFEAAWTGDIDTIKSLCLRNWGPSGDQQPLIASTEESQGFNPFVIALLRGHVDCAASILQIVEAQYEPPEQDEPTKVMYDIAGEDEDDDADDEEDEGGGDSDEDGGRPLPLSERSVTKTHTTDILSGLARRAKSHQTPWIIANSYVTKSAFDQFIFAGLPEQSDVPAEKLRSKEDGSMRYSIASHALRTNRTALFKAVHGFTEQYMPTTEPQGTEDDFALALKQGRLDAMKELISLHAAGLPLKTLIKKGDDNGDDDSNDYPGLTVRGRKNKKWAQRQDSGRYYNPSLDFSYGFSRVPPLLHAAGHINLASTEFFLSEQPLQMYLKTVKRLPFDDFKTLAGSADCEDVIRDWLFANNHLALHHISRIEDESNLFHPEEEQLKAARLLIDHLPEALNSKEPEYQATPLMGAFAFWNYDVAKMLIEAGADQRARDRCGRNIIHVLLNGMTYIQPNVTSVIPVDWLEKFMALIDPDILRELLVQRSSGDWKPQHFLSLTPLAAFLRDNDQYIEPVRDADIIDRLIRAQPEALDMLDGAGDTPLHICVHNSRYQFVVRILSHRPDLLWRESGTGRTPHDVARDLFLNSVFSGPPPVDGLEAFNNRQWFVQGVLANNGSLTRITPGNYGAELEKKEQAAREERDGSAAWITYDVCRRELAKPEHRTRKRRVVSLFEAKAVSERLAKRIFSQRRMCEQQEEEFLRRQERGEDGEDEFRRPNISPFSPVRHLC